MVELTIRSVESLRSSLAFMASFDRVVDVVAQHCSPRWTRCRRKALSLKVYR